LPINKKFRRFSVIKISVLLSEAGVNAESLYINAGWNYPVNISMSNSFDKMLALTGFQPFPPS